MVPGFSCTKTEHRIENATKPATTETGARINVPLFINEGDKIKIGTEKANYLERVKE